MTLESFDAEAHVSGGTLRAEVPLSEVVSGGVVAHWSEAVAVVEELCQGLTQSGHEDRVPALEDVLLNAGGQLRIVYGSRGEKGPVAAARLLHALMGSADIPVQLRLFLSQSTAPDTHGSIGEFASALAYFGRSDRAELIQALYQRCASRPPGSQPLTMPPPVPLQPVEPKKEPKAAQPRRGPGASRRIGWIAAGLLVVAGVAGAWIWTNGNPDADPAEAASGVVDAVTGAFEDFSTTARELMGETRIVPRDAPPGDGETSPPSADAVAPTTASATSGGASAPSSAPAVSTPAPQPASPVTASAPSPTIARAATETPARPELPVTGESGPAIAPREASSVSTTRARADAVIYSQEDEGIVPPSLVAPQLPLPFVTVEDQAPTVNRMEVLVGADGTVERVRLLAGPRRMPDMMLLSGAKTWRFEPALKDGVPVRYRTVLSWTVTP